MKGLAKFLQSFQLAASVTILLILLQQISLKFSSDFEQPYRHQWYFRAFITLV